MRGELLLGRVCIAPEGKLGPGGTTQENQAPPAGCQPGQRARRPTARQGT